MRILLIKSENWFEHRLFGHFKDAAFVVETGLVGEDPSPAVCKRDFFGRWQVLTDVDNFLKNNQVKEIYISPIQSVVQAKNDYFQVLGNIWYRGVYLKPARAIAKILGRKDYSKATFQELITKEIL